MEKENPANNDYKYVEFTGLPNEFFTLNRTNYLNNLERMLTGLEKNSIIVLQGGDEIPRYDTDVVNYHFAQEGNFYYLSGVTEPKFYGILDVQSKEFILYYDLDKDERDNIFMKIPSLEELSKKYGLKVLDKEDLYKNINERDPKKIYVINGVNTDSGLNVRTAKLVFPQPYEDLEKRVDANPYIYEILADTRTRKTQEEISLLKFISKITIEAHLEAHKIVQPDIVERDVENAFFNYLKSNYYTRLWAYPCICGCGVDASTLHYVENTQTLKKGDLMLMDMGICLGGYRSDVTSTIPVSGTFTPEQKKIYDTVLKANREVIKNLKPGVYWPDMHILAEKVILAGLVEAGILQGDQTQMLNDRVSYYFMPHGLGHFLGIETHDCGGYLSFTPKRSDQLGLKSLRTSRYLEVGNVITVEPGLYFIPYLLDLALKDDKIKKYLNADKLKTYYNFGGVRIEDDVVITVEGCENMTEKLPRETKDIEAFMKQKWVKVGKNDI